jgi:hypothetical protein
MDSDKQIKKFAIQPFAIEQFVSLIIHSRLMIMSFFPASGLAAAGQCRVRLEWIYFILRMIFFSISNITFMENLFHQINDSGDVFSLSLSLSLSLKNNQFLNQKPINVKDCIKAVDGEVRVPRVDSLKRHVLKRFQSSVL